VKNLVFALLGLIAIIIIVFVFASKEKLGKDTLIPTPSPVPTPQLEILNKNMEATTSGSKKQYSQSPPTLTKEEIKGKKVRIKTVKGDIVFGLFENSPIASSNFIFLAGEKFYDGLTFHRREEKFVIQGGDPQGNGTGGPGYRFDDEVVTGDYKRGIVAMANAGPNTNGSQFFIMLADAPLPKNYTIFGQVIEGIEVVDQIAIGDVMERVTIE